MLTARQEIDRVLSELGGLVGAPLRLDADGVIVLEFADDVTCTIEVPEDSGRVFIELGVERLPREGRELVLAAALERNRFGLDVDGACLALDEAGEELLLCHSLPAHRSELDNLSETLAALIAEVSGLRSLLRERASARRDGGADRSEAALPDTLASTLLFRG